MHFFHISMRLRLRFIFSVLIYTIPFVVYSQEVKQTTLNEAPLPLVALDTTHLPVSIPNKAISQPWNRTAIISDYVTNFLGSTVSSTELGWTGSTTGCIGGSISQLAQNRTMQRINYYRRLVGLSDNTTLDPSRNAAVQEAALMMLANNNLSHTPPLSWLCYTALGATGAGNSNIALGSFASTATKLYMDDPGLGNEIVGHRRWILYSRAASFGLGSTLNSDAMWVFNTFVNPPSLPPFVAFPPAGYVPRPLIPGRWSFSIPSANFSTATIQVQDQTNTTVPVVQYPITNGYGDNTIVWDLVNPAATLAWNGSADKTFYVQVSGVILNGVTQPPYSYTVVGIDPGTFCPYPTPVAACSVTAGNSPSIYYGLEQFQFNTIDVASSSADVDGSTYIDRSCINSTTVTSGSSYSLSAKGYFNNSHNIKVYIDFNNNGILTDAGELVASSSGNLASTTFTIPTSASVNIPLRIRVLADAPGTASGPCVVVGSPTFGGGQIEDFAVVIQAAPCASMYTVKAGNWNDPTVWSCNRLPTATDAVEIRHAVTVPASITAIALKVKYLANQKLTFGVGARLVLTQ